MPGYITVTPGGHGPNGRLASTRPHPSFLGTQVTHVDLSCTEQIVPCNLRWRMAVLLSLRPWARIWKDHPDRMLAGARLLRFQTNMWRTARPRGPQGQANPEDGQGWMQPNRVAQSRKGGVSAMPVSPQDSDPRPATGRPTPAHTPSAVLKCRLVKSVDDQGAATPCTIT